ncbi:hypothetical protein H6G27_15250 [Nostoc linckia FACHB-104]|nr:hypothetical protein [Nostoc linckia FACHB-104]
MFIEGDRLTIILWSYNVLQVSQDFYLGAALSRKTYIQVAVGLWQGHSGHQQQDLKKLKLHLKPRVRHRNI